MKKHLILLMALLLSVTAVRAYDFAYEYGGQNLYFDFTDVDGECALASTEGYVFGDEFTIPSVVTYDGREYTVTEIKDTAVGGATSQTIVLPNTLKEIGMQAFWYSSLRTITIPASVESMGAYVFEGCENLRTVTFEGTKSPYMHSTFKNCTGLTEFHGTFVTDDHRCIIDDGHLKALICTGITTYTVPESVTCIESGVFSGNGSLESIVLPNTLKEIGMQAFWYSSLRTITIPASVESMGGWVFEGCGNLQSITLGAQTPNSIEGDPFDGFENFETCTLYVPAGTGELYRASEIWGRFNNIEESPIIENGLKYLYTDSTYSSFKVVGYTEDLADDVEIPSTLNGLPVVSIVDDAFWGSVLKTVTIPASVTHIGSAFYSTGELTTVTFMGDNPDILSENSFWDCTKLREFIGEDMSPDHHNIVRSDGCLVAVACAGMTEYTVPEGVTHLGAGLFSSKTYLTKVTLPSTLKSIGWRALWCCTGLSSIDIPDGLTRIDSDAFSSCKFKHITIPASVEKIDERAFGYSAIETVEFLGSPTLCDEYHNVFEGCVALREFSGPQVADDHRSFVDASGKLVAAAMAGVGTYTAPSNVNTIGRVVFAGYSSPFAIVVPETVKILEPHAFWRCNLTSITVLGDLSDIDLTETDPFLDFPNFETCTLYVPEGTADLYRNSEFWGRFARIVEGLPVSVDLVDGTPHTASEDKYCATITYSRTFANTNWQALYVPFDMEYEDWADLGEVAVLNDIDNDNETATVEFTRLTSGTLKAHTPCIFKPAAAGDATFTVTNATLYAAPVDDEYVCYPAGAPIITIYGTYKVKEGLYDLGAYALSAQGQFVRALSSSQTLNPYRIYVIVSSAAGAPARIRVSVDGETNSIDDVMIMDATDNGYYDLLGRRVINPQPGIYIHNGKKVMIK